MTSPPVAPPPLDPATAARRDARRLLLLLVLVALLLRLPLMGRSIWFDEACMSDQRIGTWEQLLATLYVDIHPPLYVAFMHFWNGVFGDSEWSMRTPPLVCGLASIPLCWWAGHRMVGRRAALWATALLSLSPVHVWYSVEARLYAPMLACVLLAAGCVDRLLDPAQPRRAWLWWLHTANVAVMLALHYYLAVFVVLFAALAPLLRGFTPAARRLMVTHAIGILLLGGFVVGKRALGEFATGQDYLGTLTFEGLAAFVFEWCWTGNTLPAAETPLDRLVWRGGQALGVLLLAAGLFGVWRSRRGRPTGVMVPLCLLALPAFLMAAAVVGLGNTYNERSTIAALPFVFLLAGKGLTSLPAIAGRWLGVAALTLSVASLVALFRFGGDHWTVYKPNPDWRAAAGWLGAEIDAGGAGRAVFTPTPNPRSLSYYDPRIQDEKNLTPPTDPARLGAKVRQRLGEWLGDYAERVFTDFAAHNAALLDGARLRVYHTAPDPAALRLAERSRDDVCYLVRDRWHPNEAVDDSHEALLRHPRVEVLETHTFRGVTVRKVRIRP